MSYQTMATRQMSAVKSQTGLRSFTRALAFAFNEWLLMLMLFLNSVFSYVITWFADYSEIQSPCMMCSRLDHILGRTKHLKKSHWDTICSKHKSEISSLVYCHAHGKLVDVRGMCETCLFSFATTNKSNAETYRLLVGKLGEGSSSCLGSMSDQTTNPRYCTCCNQLWMPQNASTEPVAKPEMLPKIRVVGNLRTGGKQASTPKKSVSFNNLPHVGYTELKFHSDTESEAVFSEDEGAVKEEYRKYQAVDLETPRGITLSYDMSTDKLLDLDFPMQPLQENNLRTSLFELETSEKVGKEEEIHSFDNLFMTSRSMEDSAAVLKEKEELIRLNDVSVTPHLKEHPAAVVQENEELIQFDDVSLTTDFKEIPGNASLEETELICLNDDVSTSVLAETPEDVLKGIDLMSLHDVSVKVLTFTPNETSVEMLKERDTSPADISSLESEDVVISSTKSVPENSTESSKFNPPFECMDSEKVVKEEEIISVDNIFVTSRATEPSEVVLKETEDLIHLQDNDSTPHFEEVPASTALKEETELRCLCDISSTSSDASETPEDVVMEKSVSEEKEEMIGIQDTSSTPEFKENSADALMEETELICLSDATLTSVAAENREDLLKGIELMPLHDISSEEVPESFTTNETCVEMSKESNTNQAEDIVVSSSESMPGNPTESCVSEDKEMKETILIVSSMSEMASHTGAAHESESSSFNSMSVAAETNQYSGELLDLADAYNIIVNNEDSKDSNRGEAIEQWMKKDTSRVSEDLKALLTQISASRGIEFLSPRDVSPKICSDQETTNLDIDDMQLLLQKRMLERNESNLSLEGVSVSEIEGESESDRLKRQVDHDRKLLAGLYKELEEERSASSEATNQAMAMITRLQEEKALFQMEALQNLRMMEEQAEYDMEAIQKLNDLLVEKEKVIQDLEAEIEYFRDQTPQKKNKLDVAEKVTGAIDSPSEGMNNRIQSCLSGLNEERLYITNCLVEIENRVNGEANVDNVPMQESISELHERVEKLKGDLYFLEHVVNSLGHGNEGVQFVKEIASHLQTLRSLSMKRLDHAES